MMDQDQMLCLQKTPSVYPAKMISEVKYMSDDVTAATFKDNTYWNGYIGILDDLIQDQQVTTAAN